MSSASPGLARSLAAAADAVASSAAELNRLDGFAGDGDLGITMSAAARALKEVLDLNEQALPEKLLAACGAAIARHAPSTSGTLVATGLLRAAKVVAEPGGDDVEILTGAFRAAQEGIQARGKAAVGDRTMVDGLQAVCTSLQTSSSAGLKMPEALQAAAEAASRAADATAEMVPRIGRASWVPDRARGHPDAGCAVLAIALQAVAETAGS
ncbi:MAG: DAK2 domain-containing protein [Acidimicrobiales bacterium]